MSLALIDRHEKILRTIELLRTVSVTELKDRLAVSEVTVRKDLSFLEDEGLIIRTHGGARLAQDINRIRTLNVRERENSELKRSVARRAVGLIREGDTIYLDSGSTCQALAEEIRDAGLSVLVLTSALPVMNILSEAEMVNLHCIGGSFRRQAGCFVGAQALANLSEHQIETCFVGITGFTADGVFSSQNVVEAELKKAILSSSRRRVVIADSTKADIRAFSICGRLADVDILVTNRNCNIVPALREEGLEVLLAD